jgi:hypothetical protein
MAINLVKAQIQPDAEHEKLFHLEVGSSKTGETIIDYVYLVRFDSLFIVQKFLTFKDSSSRFYREEEVLFIDNVDHTFINSFKRNFKRLARLDYYKCTPRLRGGTKKLKKYYYKEDWKYFLTDRESGWNGPGRSKLPLINRCISMYETILERHLINQILRKLKRIEAKNKK